jgi:hypothetical protein
VLPEAKPAAAANVLNRNIGTVIATDKPDAVAGPQIKATFENRLVLASDSDPAAAERELNEVLAQAGIHTLTQQQATPASSMFKAAPAPPAARASKSAHGSSVQPIETLVYTGTLSSEQVSNLNAQVAQNGTFTVAAKSTGEFAQMPVTQNSFRARNNFQSGAQNASGGSGQGQSKATGGNVRSGEQAYYGYNSNAAAAVPAAPAGPMANSRGGGFPDNAAKTDVDTLKAENQAQVPVVIEVQARRQQSP